MADFSIAFTAGAVLATWEDPPTEAGPSRLNPVADRPHRRRVAELGSEIEITASTASGSAPMDDDLDGRLFYAWFAEHVAPLPRLDSPPGQSSVIRFTPRSAGHYAIVVRRVGSGGFILHVDVQ